MSSTPITNSNFIVSAIREGLYGSGTRTCWHSGPLILDLVTKASRRNTIKFVGNYIILNKKLTINSADPNFDVNKFVEQICTIMKSYSSISTMGQKSK